MGGRSRESGVEWPLQSTAYDPPFFSAIFAGREGSQGLALSSLVWETDKAAIGLVGSSKYSLL